MSADGQSDDLRACEPEPVMEVDGIAGEIASQMSDDDGPIRRLFDCCDLGMKVVLATHLLRPSADGLPPMDVTPFVAHDGVPGEARGDAVGIVAIGRGEVGGNGLGQLDAHGFNSSATISIEEVGLYCQGGKAAGGCHSLTRVKHSRSREELGGPPWMSA
jgi:hypothetical protein